MAGQGAYARAAEPVLAYAARLASVGGEDQTALIRQAGVLLDRFAGDLGRAAVPPAAVPPARLALALVVDRQARENRRLDLGLWAAGASRHLFDGREMSPATLADFRRRAEVAGPDYAGLAGFLADCEARLDSGRQRLDRRVESGWFGIVAVLVVAFLAAVLGWTAWVEWRFHRDLAQVFAAEALEIGLDRPTPPPDLAARLDRLQAAAARVEAAAAAAQLRLIAGPFGFDAADDARGDYRAAVNRHLPAVLAAAMDEALATEGDPATVYDTLRAVDLLNGGAAWSRAFLAGWMADRGALLPGLAPHVAALDPPGQPLPADPELLAQARDIAAEASEADLAFLELRRSEAAALAPWQAEIRVPGLTAMLRRRSGRAMDQPLPGLFTEAGWTLARDSGAGLAVQAARDQAARLLPRAPPRQNDAPDRVLALLQARTLAVWRDYLADLRVRPFTDPAEAVRISGALARKDSALEALLHEVWRQAGGTDRRRRHDLQLAVAAEFAPMIQYVEQGRMADIAALFAGLNVALGAMDRDEPTGMQRLMGVQGRAASVAALRQAPVVVVQIVEDVLAQTGAAQADLLSNPLTRAWQVEVLGACRGAVEGRFPFADGPDADPVAVARLLGPGGAVDRFLKGRAAAYLDMTGQSWRWKPEARFAGLTPDSAEMLQRFALLGDLYAGGAGGARLSFAALAERGAATVGLGGVGGPVDTRSEPLALDWPGPDPARGMEVSFRSAQGSATLAAPGPWGLLRLLGPLRLRERDGGQRFLVDLRAEGARLFVEIGFDRAANLLSRRALFRDLTCAQVL